MVLPIMFHDSIEGCNVAGGATGPSSLKKSFHDCYEETNTILGYGVHNMAVREAICKETRRRVAVKSFCKQAMREKDLQNMRSEVKILPGLEHPGIVSFEAAFEDVETVQLVTEKLEGGELFDRLSGRSFSEYESADVASQILEALAYLHERGIAHRDVKPENVLYTSQGGSKVKLIDFGLACTVAGDDKKGRCGTLGYAAPEVLSGRSYDEKCDLWSVGCVLYDLLTGNPLFSGDKPQMLKDCRAGRVRFGKEFYALSKDAQELLSSLLCASPSERPSARQALAHRWVTRRDSTPWNHIACEWEKEAFLTFDRGMLVNDLPGLPMQVPGQPPLCMFGSEGAFQRAAAPGEPWYISFKGQAVRCH